MQKEQQQNNNYNIDFGTEIANNLESIPLKSIFKWNFKNYLPSNIFKPSGK